MTATARSTQSDISGDSQQFGLATTVNGVGYLWRPWFATLNVNLTLMQNSTQSNPDDLTARQRSNDRLLSGQVRLNLFPSSRFPQESFVDIYDSRIETDRVGVALDDIKALRRERIGVTQQYRPATGNANYTVQALRTRVLENGGAQEAADDLLASGSHRFKSQALDYRVSFRDLVRDEPALRRQDTLAGATLRHEYRPDESLSVESVLDTSRDRELLNLAPSRAETDSSLDTFTTWRPAGSSWSVRTHLGGKRSDSTLLDVLTRSESVNGSAAVSYEWSRALRLTAEAGGSQTRATGSPESVRSFENASLSYAPDSVPLGGFRYRWSASANAGNADATGEPGVRTGSAGARHGLDWVSSNDEGRTLTTSLNQGATLSGDSRGGELLTVNHLASGAVLWRGDITTSLVQLNVSDARTRGRQAISGGTEPVAQVLQTADVHASEEVLVSRATTLDGDLRMGASRQDDRGIRTNAVFSNASAGYGYAHVFGVDRLRFRSRLEYSLRRTVTETVSTEVDERASFDNKLDYIVGLLTLGLRRTITKYDGHWIVITVASASRVF